jgi:membrane-associated phospholipid phosphatase
MKSLFDLGVAIVHFVQGWGGWLEQPMKLISFLGTEDFFMLVLPIVYWCIDTNLGMRVAFILMFSGSVNDMLKMAFHWPRPYWYSTQVKGLTPEISFGMPSFHAQTAMSIWGMLADWLCRWWAWLACGLIIFLIGLSRLYLGVHFPHDVLFGWLVGGLVLWLSLRFWAPVTGWLKKQNRTRQILVGFLASLLVIGMSLVPFLWLRLTGWQVPAEWTQNAQAATGVAPAPVELASAMTYGGTVFGLAIGLAWITSLGGFQARGPFWKLALRFLLGLAGVLAIRYGLKAAFELIAPEAEALVPYFLRYIRYVCIGAWMSGAAPWLFLKWKLAERAQ